MIKTLAKSIREYKPSSIGSAVFMVGSNGHIPDVQNDRQRIFQ